MAAAKPREHLVDILHQSAKSEKGLTFYLDTSKEPSYLSYKDLLREAQNNASVLLRRYHAVPGQIVLIHFHTHYQNVVWFWSCLLAGCVPAMSTPFVNNREGRIAHMEHLNRLLLSPLVLTSSNLVRTDFVDNNSLRVVIIDKESTIQAIDKAENELTNLAIDVDRRPPETPEWNSLSNSPSMSATISDLSTDVSLQASPHIVAKLDESIPIDLFDSTHLVKPVDEQAITERISLEEKPDSIILKAENAMATEALGTDFTLTDTPLDKQEPGRILAVDAHDKISKEDAPVTEDVNQVTRSKADTYLPVTDASKSTSLENVAFLMLTSGSTGNAKAVCLRHDQVLAACAGKLHHMPMPENATVLNWIALDHVGSLIELHLTAMQAVCHQVHVPASDVVSDPLGFLKLLSKHQIVRTFAPNFFLHNLEIQLAKASATDLKQIDLSSLHYIISGGEPNSVSNCVELSKTLSRLGAVPTVITPGFGMTETCAGSIYSRRCPEIDVPANTEFAALGTCIPGIEMRVATTALESEGGGELQVRGPLVFERYFNNEQATADAFTEDGWFRTGDLATINDNVLRLVGRSKDLININGIKYLPQEIEEAIERENIPGIAKAYTICFAHRAPKSKTEDVFVIYQHEFESSDAEVRRRVLQHIVQTVVQFAGARPRVLPLPQGRLVRTTLGKLSRNKIRLSLLAGDYQDQIELDESMLQQSRIQHDAEPRNNTERELVRIIQEFSCVTTDFDIDTTILDIGISSVELIQLKRSIEKSFSIPDVPLITLMANTTVRTLGNAVQALLQPSMVQEHEYNPVVVLQRHGTETPLWLIHPGIGEMLVFLGLVQYFPNRPIYAMRARGLNRGEDVFTGLGEVLSTYHPAIKKMQPEGPYAIAGYSYGSMLAFEIAKILESNNDKVQFLGSFNLPPHIKARMRRLDWTAGLVHIAHFCSIITEARSCELVNELRSLPHDEQVKVLLRESDRVRCAELALDHAGLLNWTDVSWSLQKIGWEYEPSGDVAHMDIFYCQPLRDVASNRVEYRKNHLNHWVGFIRDDLKFWEVDGEHYTMIGPEHVPVFQRTLKKALAARGL